MRDRTAELHISAERSGVVAALLQGQVTQVDYALYLRNLLPVYQALEHALERRVDRPAFAALAQRSLYRSDCLLADLGDLVGPAWASNLALLPSAERYAARITLTAGDERLAAHCYTRYLGDLNGGKLVARCLVKHFGSDFRAIAFSQFPGIANLPAFRTAYRASLDRVSDMLGDVGAVVEEAAIAFELSIALSTEVAANRAIAKA